MFTSVNGGMVCYQAIFTPIKSSRENLQTFLQAVSNKQIFKKSCLYQILYKFTSKKVLWIDYRPIFGAIENNRA